jgi:hypothetical protein
MKVASILSERFHQNWPSWHVVYEWEDDFASALNVPILSSNYTKNIYEVIINNKITNKFIGTEPIERHLQHNDLKRKSISKYIVFEMSPRKHFTNTYSTNVNAIPIIIDYWKHNDVDAFCSTYKNCELVLISSLEVYNWLKENGCDLQIHHFPLSISDRYRLTETIYFDKEYDVIFAGRMNNVMLEYMMELSTKYSDVEYVYQENVNDILYYKSNKRGIIGSFHTRKEYVDLLRKSRVGIYTTPGIDGGENRTGGFNPVTPRFLELLSSKCLMLGRYPENEEINFFEVNKVCPNIHSYSEFERYIMHYLNQTTIPTEAYIGILSKHYTTNRVIQLNEIIGKINDDK